jgi:hypothetical protein
MLVTGTIFYRDFHGVKRFVESAYEHVDRMILVNGKFTMRDEEPGNDDISYDWLRQFHNIEYYDIPADEPTKRSVYLKACLKEKIKYLIWIDSDEWFSKDSDWKTFKQRLEETSTISPDVHTLGVMCSVNTLRPDHKDAAKAEIPTPFPRIIIDPWKYEYFKAHMLLRRISDGELFKVNKFKDTIHGITILGNNILRTPEFEQRTYEYQQRLMIEESPYRKALHF